MTGRHSLVTTTLRRELTAVHVTHDLRHAASELRFGLVHPGAREVAPAPGPDHASSPYGQQKAAPGPGS